MQPRHGRDDQPSTFVRASVHGTIIIPERVMPLLPRFPSGLIGSAACLVSVLSILLSGCATSLMNARSATERTATDDSELIERLGSANYVLLGELHDHPEQHRRRLEWLHALSAKAPITLVMEHFDVEAQAKLDAARLAQNVERPLSERAREVAQAAGFRFDGWDWSLIGPVVEFALQNNVPLMAGNLSSRESYSIARGQPHRLDRAAPEGWGVTADATLSALIRDGHCGLLPESMIAPMMRAQRARDAQMAEVLLATRASQRKPVLLAGNAHVRRDVGVPAHLRALDRGAVIVSIGLLEVGSEREQGAFDAVRFTAKLDRPDPCEDLKKRFGKPNANR